MIENALKEQILNLMNQEEYLPSNIDIIFNKLNLTSSKDFTYLAKTLNQLVDENLIAYDNKGNFALIDYFNMAKGIIDVKEAGFAFVDTEFGGIFVPPSKLKGAITSDEVMIKFFIDQKGRYEGEVIKIIQRNNNQIIGTLTKYRGKNIVKPVDPKINLKIFIQDNDFNHASVNDIVKVEIIKYFLNQTADAKIIEVIGNKNIPGLDITSLVMASKVKTEFPKDVIEFAKSLPQQVNSEEELNKNLRRKDLRDLLIITIDGSDAKDLDDAIHVEVLQNGNYLLGVYIADVSHYVKEASDIDKEAYTRGTSIYLPDRVIPMLPKELSNGICSLNEGVDRLVMACEMEVDLSGNVVNYDIFEAIINSNRRMTYEDVNKILEENNVELIKKYQDIYPMLKDMEKLSFILNEMRLNRGAFEFESLEAKLILNEQGKVEEIKLRVQKTAEKLIEEFMLLANETVAMAMTWLDVPFIYRVHEEPKEEKITKLLFLLSQLGFSVKIKNKKALPKMLQQVILDLNNKDNDDEATKYAIINRMMIRSMTKAKYQETNVGHFGLASKCYTHFTSPIRRYPDLLVHRLIKEFMLGKKQTDVSNPTTYFMNKVNASGITASMTERIAENLERDATDFKKTEYMKDFIGKTFTGIISSITNYGLFVMLDNTIEGMVPYKEMYDDYYIVDEALGRIIGEKKQITYTIGERVKVRLLNVNLEKREIDFRLLGKDK